MYFLATAIETVLHPLGPDQVLDNKVLRDRRFFSNWEVTAPLVVVVVVDFGADSACSAVAVRPASLGPKTSERAVLQDDKKPALRDGHTIPRGRRV